MAYWEVFLSSLVCNSLSSHSFWVLVFNCIAGLDNFCIWHFKDIVWGISNSRVISMLTRPQMTRNCLFRFMQVPLQFNNLEHNGICQQSEGRMHGNKHGCFLVLSNALKFALLDIFFCLELDFLGCWNYFRPCTGALFIPADNFIVSPEFNKLYFYRMKTSNLAWNEHSLCLFSFYCYF